MSARYVFHVHKLAPTWRLVLSSATTPPKDYIAADWSRTRVRDAEDVNPDVRRVCDEAGFCLFKIGASFAELRADLASGGQAD